MVFDYKGRTEKATSDTEQDLTNALIKVVQGRQPKVYFTRATARRTRPARRAHGLQRDRVGADVGQLRRRQARAGAADGGARRRGRRRRRRTEDGLPARRNRHAEGVPRQGREAVPDARSGDQGRPARTRRPRGAAQGLGHGRRTTTSCSTSAGMGRLIGTDESMPVAASYPSHPITENFQLLTAYPLARSITPVAGGVNGHTAQRSSKRAATAGRKPTSRSLTGGQPAKPDEGDKQGPVSVAGGGGRPAPVAERAREGRRRSPRRAWWRSATPTSRATRFLGVQGNHDLFLNTVNWLAQQENLISIRPARRRGPPHHADGRPGDADLLPDGADRPRTDPARGRADLVAEAIACAGCRSFIVSARRRDRASDGMRHESKTTGRHEGPKLDKVFPASQADTIDRVTVTSEGGERTTVEKKGDAWQVTQPVAAKADEAEVSGITSNLASLEVQRVIDDKATDLKQYSLNPARIEVAFHGSGGDHTLLRRAEDADRQRPVREAPRQRARLPDPLVPRHDVQSRDVRPARQDGAGVRSRQGRPRRHRRRRQRRSDVREAGTEWHMTAPVDARADFGAVEGMLGQPQHGADEDDRRA